jgi:oligopeptide/dipeptide ABC transporter ATP-binding protein
VLREPLHPYSQMLLAASLLAAPPAEGTGELAAMTGMQKGCVFRPRCPHAMEVCRHTAPPLRKLQSRSFACHLERPDAVPSSSLRAG